MDRSTNVSALTPFRVSADIRYLDGTLKDLVIPAGWSVPCEDREHALRMFNWADKVHRTHDFVRAVGSGNRYRIVSKPVIHELD